MNSLLEVKNLVVSLKSTQANSQLIRDVSFTLLKGESLGIVGESGCGKSTMAKALVQLLPAQATLSGEINYKGENLLTYSDSKMQSIRRHEIGIIFQDPMSALNPTLKVGYQIVESYKECFPFVSSTHAYQTTKLIIDQLGVKNIAAFMEAYPHVLSGGMRQKAIIALTLIRQPKLLIADELTSSVDATSRLQILQTIKAEQKEKGMSVILITHDLNLIAHFCDRVLVMYAGRIVESAPVQSFLYKPQHPYSQALLKATPTLQQDRKQSLYSIEGNPPNLNISLSHCGFCSRCPDAMNICARQIPSLYSVGEAHLSACFKTSREEQ